MIGSEGEDGTEDLWWTSHGWSTSKPTAEKAVLYIGSEREGCITDRPKDLDERLKE